MFCSCQVGSHLIGKLKGLQQTHDIIGDIRGSGLMLGIDFVKDRKTKQAAPAEAGQASDLRYKAFHLPVLRIKISLVRLFRVCLVQLLYKAQLVQDTFTGHVCI